METIVITKLPLLFHNYYQWLLLGVYQLELQGRIRLRFRIGFLSWLVLHSNNRFITLGLIRFFKRWLSDSYCLEGYYQNGQKRKRFCFDIADAPYLFDFGLLGQVDAYFKMQCPTSFDLEGFRLTDQVVIPYCDRGTSAKTDGGESVKMHLFWKNLSKIHPGMVGPRQLAYGDSYAALRKGYDRYLESRKTQSSGHIMCYFGNSRGPVPVQGITSPNWNKESHLLGWFGGKINHPNEKRARAAQILRESDPLNDARIIHEGHSDIGGEQTNTELIVPLANFCNHIAKFRYNLNISGYRMSIPNRFIESFLAGTAIVTDRLAVKWFLPFGVEVFESVNMGYLPMDDVDWEQFKNDLQRLPVVSKEEVLTSYEEKWTPERFASYLVNTMRSLL